MLGKSDLPNDVHPIYIVRGECAELLFIQYVRSSARYLTTRGRSNAPRKGSCFLKEPLRKKPRMPDVVSDSIQTNWY